MFQGWDAYGYACYWMEETPRTWWDAKTFCTEQGGFLLHLGDMSVTAVPLKNNSFFLVITFFLNQSFVL